MAPRSPRSRTARAFPKTLTGLLASVALAVLAALGVKTDWFHGKPSAPPTERPTAARPAPPPGDLPHTPGTFTAAKKALYDQVYADHRVTFYCGCRYDADRRIDLASCGLESLADKPRAQRIEAEHIFPAAQFGNFRPCWRSPQDFPACAKSDGKTLSGRACCQAVDPVFNAAHNDLFNLVPAVGEVNGKRSDFNWGMIPGEKREFGTCNFEVDSSIRRVEPPENIMGDIARTMFYMADTYGFTLSRQDQQLFTAWSRQDPPDAWEIERARRIKAIQGRGNRFVEDYAALFGKTAAATPASPPAEPVPAAPAPAAPAPVAPSPAPTAPVTANQPGWACGAKTSCGQMTSCEEARFHLTQCGLKSLDRDGDGVPCASLCRP
ncbi:MAG: endonuclease [Candidatus Contendobacter sp.]|nr:endonuclease [Candidatus Contendobacter sp.]